MFPLAITFDFDDTLFSWEWDPEDECLIPGGTNAEILDDLIEAKRKGSQVFIVTSRMKAYERAGNGPSIREWLAQEDVVVDGVYFTEGDFKAETLLELGSILHYDDDLAEIEMAEAVGIPTIHVESWAAL